MTKSAKHSSINSSWLDRVAIAMAVVCGIHCLVTPVLLVALPILSTTFWTSSNFHLWMLCFVLPFAALAVFSGWRKHKDRQVAAMAILGVLLLVTATAWEQSSPREHTSLGQHASIDHSRSGEIHDSCCAIDAGGQEDTIHLAGISFAFPTFLNLLGGLVLSAGHWRNFRLCRLVDCRCRD